MARIWKALPTASHRLAAPLLALLWLLAETGSAHAADIWPNFETEVTRGPGGYLSTTKIILSWLLMLAWVKTTDLVNLDCLRLRLNYGLWNTLVFGCFVVAFLLMWEIPIFVIGFFLMLLAYAGPLTAYVLYRNSKVTSEKKVLTREHIKFFFSHRAAKVGVKLDSDKRLEKKEGPPVNFTAQGGKTDAVNNANLHLAKQSPGFPVARELIADLLDHRADAVMLDYAAEGVGVRYQIDGLWHNHEPRDRASGDVMLAVFKTLAALNANERRAKQEGNFAAEFKGNKRNCRFASQGTPTGERVVIQMVDPVDRMWSFEELGIRAKVEEQLKEITTRSKGFVIFSAQPAGGLTTTMDTAIRALDRFMRDVVAIEEEAHREHEIQNVQVTTYKSAAGETPLTVLPKLVRTYPNVIILRDLPDADTLDFLCDQVNADRLVISGVRAKESAEALLRVLMTKVPAATFAPAVTAVVNQRFVRKLCEKCKEAYAPPPETLKQLGIPAGRVQALYRPPVPPPDQAPPPPCEDCLGLGYKGRTAIFELLVVDDGVREALIKTPKLELVRAAARKAGMKTLQEEGIVMVVKGVTSLQELMRVMKG